jgi:hypothetical protein
MENTQPQESKEPEEIEAEITEFSNPCARWRALRFKCSCGSEFWVSAAGPYFTDEQKAAVNQAAAIVLSLQQGNAARVTCANCKSDLVVRMKKPPLVVVPNIGLNRHDRRAVKVRQ